MSAKFKYGWISEALGRPAIVAIRGPDREKEERYLFCLERLSRVPAIKVISARQLISPAETGGHL